MGGKIDVYIDVVSWYSYVAFADLLRNREKLRENGVVVEFHPMFLGGIMQASGNKPPWMLPAKGKYMTHDSLRASHRVHKPHMRFPPNFLQMAKSILPLRALHFIKSHYPQETYISAWHHLFENFWTPPHANISQASVLGSVLAECPAADFDGKQGEDKEKKKKLFTEADIKQIMAGAESEECKASLKRTNEDAVAKGAFGAPWLWVVNEDGKGEPFFGSDRFGYVWDHLGVPYRSLELLGKGEEGSKL